jgi:hypothetical protein
VFSGSVVTDTAMYHLNGFLKHMRNENHSKCDDILHCAKHHPVQHTLALSAAEQNPLGNVIVYSIQQTLRKLFHLKAYITRQPTCSFPLPDNDCENSRCLWMEPKTTSAGWLAALSGPAAIFCHKQTYMGHAIWLCSTVISSLGSPSGREGGGDRDRGCGPCRHHC